MKTGKMSSILWAYVRGSTVVIEENCWDNVHKYDVIVFSDESTGRQINPGNILLVTKDMLPLEIQRRISNILQGIVQENHDAKLRQISDGAHSVSEAAPHSEIFTVQLITES